MKKIVLCLLIMLSLNATAKLFAQQNGSGQQWMQAMRAYLKDSVHLSDAMVDSVMAVRMQYQPQMREIFMDQSTTDADKQTKMQNLRTTMEARYKSAGLTDAQIQQMREHEDRMRAEMRSRRNGGGQ
jgi:predicted transcriptional regulator